MTTQSEQAQRRQWLDAVWPFIATHLPGSVGSALEIGCGPAGGFVPAMRRRGWLAEGIDPEAPDALGYHRLPFEQYRPADPVDVVIACTSLHHVDDLDEVMYWVATALRPAGVIVVVEFDWERFDEHTAQWCFDRLPAPEPGVEPGWLARHRSDWAESGGSWRDHCTRWAASERLHTGASMLAALDARFVRRTVDAGLPYFFTDLAGTTAADEQSAIDAGRISGAGMRYVGQRRTRP